MPRRSKCSAKAGYTPTADGVEAVPPVLLDGYSFVETAIENQQDRSMKTEHITNDRAIQLLLQRFRDVEELWVNVDRRKRELREMKKFCASLDKKGAPDMARIYPHITEDMDLKTLWSIMVPLEREHSRTLATDEDFLITTDDDQGRSRKSLMPVSAVLDNLRSSFNVGGVFRTGDCAGIEEVMLCGYSATPENEKVSASAMGCHETVRWSQHRTAAGAIEKLKNDGRSVIALETCDRAEPFHSVEYPFPCALVLGNERFGLDTTLLRSVDKIVSIPMHGGKNSLNVVSAFAICIFEVRRQWECSQESVVSSQ